MNETVASEATRELEPDTSLADKDPVRVLRDPGRLSHDPGEPAPFILDDDAFMKAVGQELQRLRKARTGLARRLFVKKLPGNIPENTYACYEQGIRLCPLPLLVVICHTLGTTVGQVVDNALRSLDIRLDGSGAENSLDHVERALAELDTARQRLLAELDTARQRLLALLQTS